LSLDPRVGPTRPPDPPLRSPARRGDRPDALGRFLREKARLMVRGQGPPTVPLGMSRRATGLTAAEEHSSLDLVLLVGKEMITTGAPVADVTADRKSVV